MKTPKDPFLVLTVFVVVSLSVILLTWVLMPVYHHGEYYEGNDMGDEPKANINQVLSPEKLIKKVKEAILTGEATLEQIEAEEKEGEGPEGPEGTEKTEDKQAEGT